MFGRKLFLLSAILAALLASVSAQDECSDRTRPVYGFFRRPASCETLKENGECKDLVQEGYCLKTCGSCPVSKSVPPPPPESTEESTSVEVVAPAPELDEDEKKAVEYQEKLLEQVASIDDEETSEMVEILPSLTMEAPAPTTEPVVTIPAAPVRKPISCKVRALDMLQDDKNLTTYVQAIEALNLTKVLSNPNLPYTLFAPINDAWAAAAEGYGKTTPEILEDKKLLKELVFSGIISDMIVDEDAVISSATLETQSGAVLFFKYNNVYDTEVISRYGTGTILDTYIGCNFLIHTIDGVLAETTGVNGTNPDFTKSMKG